MAEDNTRERVREWMSAHASEDSFYYKEIASALDVSQESVISCLEKEAKLAMKEDRETFFKRVSPGRFQYNSRFAEREGTDSADSHKKRASVHNC